MTGSISKPWKNPKRSSFIIERQTKKMSDLYGKKLNKIELMKRIGNMDQYAHIKSYELSEGKTRGIKAIDVANGSGLEFTAIEGKCLDIIHMKYKGMNLNYMPKTGMVAPGLVDMSGTEMLRSISGGMLYTCGLLNVGNACVDDGGSQLFHGRMKVTPAEHVCASGAWEGDEYVLRVSGEMREASLFGDNLVMRRIITTRTGSRSINICDEIENQNFREEGLMLLYHVNIGYPVLDAGARYVAPVIETEPYSDAAKSDMKNYMNICEPENDSGEQVFRHRFACEENGNSAAAVINDNIGIGVYLKYNTGMLPYSFEWKSMKSGDYAFGICPSTGNIKGRVYEKEHGALKMIPPFGKARFDIEIGVLDGKSDIMDFENYINNLI
jgi:hypothetical protein